MGKAAPVRLSGGVIFLEKLNYLDIHLLTPDITLTGTVHGSITKGQEEKGGTCEKCFSKTLWVTVISIICYSVL